MQNELKIENLLDEEERGHLYSVDCLNSMSINSAKIKDEAIAFLKNAKKNDENIKISLNKWKHYLEFFRLLNLNSNFK